APFTQGREAIPIGAIGIEAADLDVDGMCKAAVGLDRSAADDIAHGIVGGDLPRQGYRPGHAALSVWGERVCRNPGPQGETMRGRLARRHTEGERVCRRAREVPTDSEAAG